MAKEMMYKEGQYPETEHGYSDQLGYLQFTLDDYIEKANIPGTSKEDVEVYRELITMTKELMLTIMKARRMDYLRYHSDEGLLKEILISDTPASLEYIKAEGGSLELPSDADIDSHLSDIEVSNGKH